jgi:hypothetical protein
MILWNLPDKCPACGCKEVYPERPNIAVPKPGEMYFICADKSCQNIWKDKVMTSKTVQMYVVHCQRAPLETPDGIATQPCDIFIAFATSPQDACKALGVDGDQGGYTSVDVRDLDSIVQGGNRVDT